MISVIVVLLQLYLWFYIHIELFIISNILMYLIWCLCNKAIIIIMCIIAHENESFFPLSM